MKMYEIIDREGLIVDTEKLNIYNNSLCRSGLSNLLSEFIGNRDLDDEELRILFKYNQFLKENCKRQ